MGGWPIKKSWKWEFDPEDGGFSSWKQTYSESTAKTGLMTWGSNSTYGLRKGPKNHLFLKWWGWPIKKSWKWEFDPEDGRFSSWKHTFSESTGKTGLMTWGSNTTYSLRKGSKNHLFCKWRELAPQKIHPENGNLTLKMGDSALENKHFLNPEEWLAE